MKKQLISVEEARKKIIAHHWKGNVEEISISFAYQRVLAEDIFAPMDLPPFDASAMDGFAILYQENTQSFKSTQTSAAGSIPSFIQKDEAMRIFTGAPIPQGADTVVIQEWAQWDDHHVQFNNHPVLGSNIRKKGSHISKGSLVYTAGTSLNPGAVATLAGLGFQKVQVHKIPKVAVLITGNEVVLSGDLQIGQIYDSNIPLIEGFFNENQIPISINIEIDNRSKIKNWIEQSYVNNDVLICTGGVSVGDYDYIPEVITELGFEIIFHGISQKPGKPLLFAKKGSTYFWGLPGNPVSVAHSLWMYVQPWLKPNSGLCVFLPMLHELKRKPGLTQFYRAWISEKGVQIWNGQDSHMIHTWGKSNSVVEIEANTADLNAGSLVKVWIF
jgi:molybdopterin molybdotransferase